MLFRSPSFAAQNKALAGLKDLRPIPKAAPHQKLARGIWTSWEEGAGTELALSGGAEGLVMDLGTIGNSDWLSLSWALPPETVRAGRFIGLVIETLSDSFVSYRPCLRYVMAQGFKDHFFRDYMVSSGGRDEQVSVLRPDPAQLEAARGTELNLFFQGRSFKVEFPVIETILIPAR